MSEDNRILYIKEKELVIARLEVLSPELYFSNGNNFHSFSRDEIITQIKEDTKVGKEFVKTELEFLRALKTGDLLNALIT